MDFWGSVAGMVELELTSADVEGLLGKVNECGIVLYDLRFGDALTAAFRVRRRDYQRIRKLCASMDCDLRLKGRTGSYWRMKSLLKRPVLLFGVGTLLAAVLLLPTRIFFVEVEGNTEVPTNRILEAAEQSGIRFGASRRAVRSEQVKNALIGAVPQLQWAGVNTRGCVAVISVRERQIQPTKEAQYPVSSMIASRDGYILSATATKGNLLVKPGDTVQAGDILISGYSDLGLCIQAANAAGEVFAQTNRELKAVTPANWLQQRENGEELKKISLRIGKKRINLWKDSGISGVTCGRMYEEYYVTLPGEFVLPLSLCVETYRLYDVEPETVMEPCADPEMEAYAQGYLLKQMNAGQIRSSQKEWLLTDALFVLKENCICHEMIGMIRQEKMGDRHE